MTNDQRRRILIFSTAYYPFVGGAEVAVKEITDRLVGSFDFDLITARFEKKLPPVEKVGNVTVYRIGSGKPKLDKIFLPFRGAVLASKLNKTHNYFCFWGIMATFASGAGYIYNIFRTLNGKKKIPMVLTLQEGDSENHLQYKWLGLISLSWKLALRQTDLLTGISNFLLHRAEKNGYKGKSFLIPNGVDFSLFSKEISDQDKLSLKNRLGKKEEDIFLVTVGRLVHKNGVDDIISATALLPENISLLVIGKGDLGHNLQKQADSLGLGNRVKFLGFVPYSELPKYLSVCDIFVRPSRSEGFGNSFIEAMAAKIPVIATPVGGIVDFIDDRGTGLFCSPDNPQSIVSAIKAILEGNSLRDSMVQNAYNRVKGSYTWDNIAPEMKQVFNQIEQ